MSSPVHGKERKMVFFLIQVIFLKFMKQTKKKEREGKENQTGKIFRGGTVLVKKSQSSILRSMSTVVVINGCG